MILSPQCPIPYKTPRIILKLTFPSATLLTPLSVFSLSLGNLMPQQVQNIWEWNKLVSCRWLSKRLFADALPCLELVYTFIAFLSTRVLISWPMFNSWLLESKLQRNFCMLVYLLLNCYPVISISQSKLPFSHSKSLLFQMKKLFTKKIKPGSWTTVSWQPYQIIEE